MPTPPIRGNGLVCKCRSEAGGTSKPRATAAFCTQNVMTMDMANETIKLHTKRITARPSPWFPDLSPENLSVISHLNQTDKSANHTPFRAIAHSSWELDWDLRNRIRISWAVAQQQRNNP